MSGTARNRWEVVVAYAALGAATQVLWPIGLRELRAVRLPGGFAAGTERLR